jgi:ribosomal protein S18 acetylase RimI-like enzyme
VAARIVDLEILPLTAADALNLEEFSCDDDDLNDFVRTDALRLQNEHATQCYLARRESTGARVLGYVALLTDAVLLESKERKGLGLRDAHPVVPALKIARLGVSHDLQRGNGIGTALVRFAYFKGIEIAESVGCRLLTLDAYPQSVGFYEKLGFVCNRSKEYRDRAHPSMRLDVFSEMSPDWL